MNGPGCAERIKQGEHIAQYETIRVRKGGAQIHVSLTLSPMKDATGKITAIATIARDITERKRAESELQRLQQLAAAHERTRLARDLHDSVLQSLAVAGLNLEAAIQGLEVNPEVARESTARRPGSFRSRTAGASFFHRGVEARHACAGRNHFKIGYLLQQLVKTIEQQWQLRVELQMDGLDAQVIRRTGARNLSDHPRGAGQRCPPFYASVVEVDLKADDHNARRNRFRQRLRLSLPRSLQ